MESFKDNLLYQVTEIKKVKGRYKYRLLYINGKKYGEFFEELLFKFNIKEDSYLSEKELNQLRGFQEEREAEKVAINYLSYKPRSINEVRRKLFGKKISNTMIDITIEKMKNCGYLDDNKYAHDWIEERIKTRGFSPFKIRSELIIKGISKEIIDKNLSRIYTPELEIETARRIAKEQIRRYKNLDKKTIRRRTINFLLRKGYNYSTIESILPEILENLFN